MIGNFLYGIFQCAGMASYLLMASFCAIWIKRVTFVPNGKFKLIPVCVFIGSLAIFLSLLKDFIIWI